MTEVVAITGWRTWCEERCADSWQLDTVTVVDRGDHLELLAHVWKREPWQRAIATYVITDNKVASVADLFPTADWCEREIAEMFGVQFTGREHTPPLLLHHHEGPPPLLRSSWLEPRIQTPWPGATEPGDDGRQGNNPGRRRQRPLGIPS